MGTALITVRADLYEDGCGLTIDWFPFGIIFVKILLVIWSVYYYIYRKKQHQRRTNQTDECVLRYEGTITNSPNGIEIYSLLIIPNSPSKQNNIGRDFYLFSISKSRTICVASVDMYVEFTVEITEPIIEHVFPSIDERKLICFCDGSYSHSMQIGYSGFRASDGTSRVRFFSPRDPKNGSTGTEVRAAYLAIRYALEKHYSVLIIHTDNSKVEQLLKRPKEKDNINYSYICQILNQYRKQQGDNAIQVVRVRGHTSRYEQGKCKIKYEFAKIDRMVRKKTRRYIKKWWNNFEQTYHLYWDTPVHYSYCA
jgi:ribonuclease HI